MRDLSLVVSAVKALIPKDFPQAGKLIKEIDRIENDYCFSAPELHRERWVDLIKTLDKFLGNPRGCEWKMMIVNVIGNKTGKEYPSREFCKDVKCPVQHILDEMLHHGKDIKVVKSSLCFHNCIKSAWDFHDWLQKHGYIIIKDE
jgi:hypothetical protein